MGIDRSKYLDVAEAQRLRTVAEAWSITDLEKGKRQGVISWMLVDLAMLTGLRVNEIARLTIKDFNTSRSSLNVQRTKRRKAVSETLAISPELTEHLKKFIAWKKTVGESVNPANALLCGKRGSMTSSGMQKVWKSAIERAGLPRELSIHSARHTMAVHLLAKTKNLKQVQQQLGHSSPVVTANLYAQVQFDEMREGTTKLYTG